MQDCYGENVEIYLKTITEHLKCVYSYLWIERPKIIKVLFPPPKDDIQIQCDCNGKPWRDFVEPELITRFLWRQEPRITKTFLKSTQWGLVQHQDLWSFSNQPSANCGKTGLWMDQWLRNRHVCICKFEFL